MTSVDGGSIGIINNHPPPPQEGHNVGSGLQLGNSGPSDGARDGLDGGQDCVHKLGQVPRGGGVTALLGQEEPSEGHAVRIDGTTGTRHLLRRPPTENYY